jgi:hypothetical protein
MIFCFDLDFQLHFNELMLNFYVFYMFYLSLNFLLLIFIEDYR